MSDILRFQLSRALFLRLLGAIYLLAFGSLSVQILGLIGTNGLLPVDEFLERGREFYGSDAYYLLPTLLWFSATDAMLHYLCFGGIALAVLAIIGITPIFTFAALWLFYLSLTVGGQTFLSFQWDTLLLESGLLACLYAPTGWRLGVTLEPRPSAVVRWLVWGLAFKVTLLSGVTKLVSGDQTWSSLSALTFHYQTQPIPAWTSWFIHHFPDWFQQVSVIFMFGVEILVPFLIFVPVRFRSVRVFACGLLCLLQLVIALTGNYGFFNLLTIVLYLTLLDDGYVQHLLPRRMIGTSQMNGPKNRHEPMPWRVAVVSVAIIVAGISTLTLWREATYTRPQPDWSNRVTNLVRPIRSINGYGLFRTMTTERLEVVIEGTGNDGQWKDYSFRWKPGALSQRPSFVQPHMPRLDWLMWFAALDPYAHQHWLGSLVEHILHQSPTVMGLLAEDPFPDGPPEFVRLAIYEYRFTTPDERTKAGNWWHRELRSYLSEPMSVP